MTEIAAALPTGTPTKLVRFAPILFGVTVFASASLVFLVEPMIAKLVLPTLGGSPAVWNTSMAFFQVALLVGYAYAHLLQRVKSLKGQAAIHALVLLLAAMTLPLHVTDALGVPTGRFPIPWLLGVLAISLGAPFAALSATAPLAQAWYARVRRGQADAGNPYVLYAASNLGSLIALVAYPALVEPLLKLHVQTVAWTFGYLAFVLLMLGAAVVSVTAGSKTPELKPKDVAASRPRNVDRLIWVGLAAIPSSLVLGVTNHITTDIASAPFLWVVPLALYLLTFILAFSDRASRWLTPKPAPASHQDEFSVGLIGQIVGGFRRDGFQALQAAALCGVVWTIGMRPKVLLVAVAVHLVGFFLTALLCHATLARRRPDPAHLTEFYLWIAVGGVVGGGFNAFLAPILFQGVWEYPIVLVLSCFARPWGGGLKLSRWEAALSVLGLGAAVIAIGIMQLWVYGLIHAPKDLFLSKMLMIGPRILFSVTPVCAFLLRDRALYFAVMILVITVGAPFIGGRENLVAQARSFFGVMRVTEISLAPYADRVRLLAHGTTLHGAQVVTSEYVTPCRPMTYYAPETPIGQVFLRTGLVKRSMVVGAVGMGSGSVAGYARPDDQFRFYEIDPTVVAISGNGQFFTYISKCAKDSHVDWRIGDARLTLAHEKNDSFDILLVDAFSSDAVPAHLLTVEAMQLYLSKIKPDGVVIMHLSNRNLDLKRPVTAVADAAGGYALAQYYEPADVRYDLVQSAEDVIIVGRDKAALEHYRNDWHWQPPSAEGVAPWTDDYTNLMASMIRRLKDRYGKDKTAGPPY